MNKLLILYLFLSAAPLLQAQQDFKSDFDFLWNEIDKNYAYFERQGTDWNAVKTHYRVSEDKRWTEVVKPQGKTYDKPIYVLVNYWAGSMGEGMTIGLDAFGNNTVIGTSMAGLLGANYSVNLPNSNYRLNITFERLYHVDGTPREDYLPGVMLGMQELLTQMTRG